MSVIATAVRHLLAAGVTGDALVAAIAEMEAAGPRDAAMERRRTWDRERKRRARASGGSPPDRVDNADIADTTPAPDKETLPPAPPIKEITPTPVRALAGAREGGGPHEGGERGGDADRPDAPKSAAPAAKRRWPKEMPPPPDVSDDQWAGFVAHRLRKREPLTERAYELIRRKLAGLAAAGWPPGELIDTAVERGWITVFEPRDQGHGNRPHHDRTRRGRFRDPLLNVDPERLDPELG